MENNFNELQQQAIRQMINLRFDMRTSTVRQTMEIGYEKG